MASRGFLIRFIDIGLIVLFGFLMISDIEASSRVDLASAAPEAEVLEPQDEEDDRGLIVVAITAEGGFIVYDPELEDVITNGLATAVGSAAALEAELRDRRAAHAEEGRETLVLIEPSPASLVQFTVDVMDVCDRLEVAKSLRMDIELEPMADPGPEDAP